MGKLDFGKKLIEVRKTKGLTQDEVAEKCNVTVRTIQRIESGDVNPRAFTIKVISEALGFDFFEESNTGYETNKEEPNLNPNKRTILWYIKDLFNLKTNAMKKISILTTVFLTMGFAIVSFIPESKAQSNLEYAKKRPNYINTKDRIEVAFTNELTFDSLVYIKDDLKTRGMTVIYKKIGFDEKNQLSSIDCRVECNDGYSGEFSTGLIDLADQKNRFGFYRDYSEKTKSPFGTGLIAD